MSCNGAWKASAPALGEMGSFPRSGKGIFPVLWCDGPAGLLHALLGAAEVLMTSVKSKAGSGPWFQGVTVTSDSGLGTL